MTRSSRRFTRRLVTLAILASLAFVACWIIEARRAPAAQQAECTAMEDWPVPPAIAAADPTASYISSDHPPARFHGDTTVRVEFRSPEAVARICQGRSPPPPCGYQIGACYVEGLFSDRIVMPNPCLVDEAYAGKFCHEVGHKNGWPGTHGQ